MTLAFVHGAGCTPEVFAAQAAAFPGSRALALPGHEGGAQSGPSSIAEFADAVVAQLGNDPRGTVLCGSSMGGAIALEVALRGVPLAGVVLIGSGGKMRVAPALFDDLENDFDAAAARLAPKFFAVPAAELVDAAVRGMRFVGRPQTVRDFRACDAFDVLDRLGELRVPLLALTGEADVLMPPKFATGLADRVPGATARILPGAGHLAMIERPLETNAELRAFVESLPSR